MKKRLTVLILLFLPLVSCKKEITPNYSSTIIGEWSWIISCVGTGTGCWTAVSTNTTRNLIFTTDSKCISYQNDTLIASIKFHTFKSLNEDGKSYSNLIKYESGFTDMFSISHDTLSLENLEGIVTIVSRYKRIKLIK
jgi:hypothetical protein